MIWFLLSPAGAILGVIVGVVLGIIMGIIPLLLSLIPLFFQAIFWLARTAVQIVFYGLICGYLILEWIAKKIRKAIYSDEYEELHF
ncbi:hypothetical protein ACPBEH_11365 (plasmid) [Latilactobacillus sp. 5-91]|uniref:hypothetical protein n=1 Tax=Latilactobacillus sp. 5-91 TaxID=3410924 RepID=UPI003C739DE7